ncbi:MAG: hypothetical protein UT80_C0044G0006, partial [Parcubacteria group bacterium GW2011_GWC1_40_13]
FLFEHSDKFTVGKIEISNARVYSGVPQSSEIAFFVSAMGKGIRAGVEYRFVGLSFFVGSSESVPFGHSKDIFSCFYRCCPSFYSCHIIELLNLIEYQSYRLIYLKMFKLFNYAKNRLLALLLITIPTVLFLFN